MISLPFRRSPRGPNIEALYGMIVAQARSPAFYRGYGVPDTVTGRFEMIVLHLVLLLRQMRAAGAGAAGQRVFDRFCRDIDDNFREMGVGDLAVPKEMRKVAQAYYGRAKAYEAALDGGDCAALAAAVGRNVFGAAEPSVGARRLATYIREAVRCLASGPPEEWAGGRLGFPDPEGVAAAELEGMS
jgi:cytochrome b pre-mRNA-processing protein 3